MTQQFDSGLAAPARTLIRKALITALARPYLRAVLPLPRPLKDGSEDELALLAEMTKGRTPCLLVALGKKTYGAVDMEGLSVRGTIDVVVYAASGNSRGDIARLAGDVSSAASDSADPGIETMLEHIEQVMIGQELDVPSAYAFTAASEDELATLEDFAIWEQRYELAVQIDINPSRAITGVATSIGASHDLEDDEHDTDPVNPLVTTVTALDAP